MGSLQRTRPSRSAIGRFVLAAGVAGVVAAATPLGVLADPYGANSTPGTLKCPSLGLDVQITSGSPAARAVQIAGTGQVFIVQAAPEVGYAQAAGTSSKWVTCTLYEPGPGGVGTLTVLGYLSR
jgi:hypothetical protein